MKKERLTKRKHDNNDTRVGGGGQKLSVILDPGLCRGSSFLYLLDASLEELPLKYLPPLSLCLSLLVIIHLIRHPHIYVFIYINI